MFKILANKLLLTAAFVIFVSGCAVTVTEQMIVSPSTDIDQANLSQLVDGSGYQERFIQYPDGTNLHTLQLDKPGAPLTIVVFHGNALNMTLQPWFGLLDSLSQFDVNVIALDYQGFGKSDGVASFSNMSRDAELLMSTIAQDSQIIVYGLSLGSVMAMSLSEDPRVKGVILEGAVSTDKEMIEFFRDRNRLGRFASLDVDPNINFDNNAVAENLTSPMLVIHGKDDENIPYRMGQSIYNSYQGDNAEFLLVENGGHCDTFHVAPSLFDDAISGFISEVAESGRL